MIPIKVLNLERSHARRREFVDMNDGLAYEFHRATDGRALSEREIHDERHFVHPLSFPGRGAYGCALSHLELWDQVIDTGEPLTIVEDDAVLRSDFAAASHAVLSQLPPDWDFVLWGWNFDSILSIQAMPDVSPTVMLFNQPMLRDNLARYRASSTTPVAYRLDKCFGVPAYTLSPEGARRFKAACFPLRELQLWFPLVGTMPCTGLDIAMNQLYPTLNAFVAFPPLAVTKNDHAVSTIQNGAA